VTAGEHGHSEDDIRYVRRRYLSPERARAMAVEIANATFAARHQAIWGTGSAAVASDSIHFGAFDQNIFTEWRARNGGRGVPIYWHVRAVVIPGCRGAAGLIILVVALQPLACRA